MSAPVGRVALVGAGPGDPELLTLKAVRLIGAADVLLVDDLVNRAVMVHARAGARIVEVGKRGGCRSTSQRFIERLMVSEALAGRNVVRLKGGDPFVFGRGGEEAQALIEAGIEVEVVQGITAGIAAPAQVGIPITHRDLAHGAILVTGHDSGSGEPDWAALARCGLTLVIYMGVANVARIQAALLAAGMPPHTPAAAIQNACLAAQSSVTADLAGLAVAMRATGIGTPAIIVIGAVASYARKASKYAASQGIGPQSQCLRGFQRHMP